MYYHKMSRLFEKDDYGLLLAFDRYLAIGFRRGLSYDGPRSCGIDSFRLIIFTLCMLHVFNYRIQIP
jgi:hypothetical protein